ncbi:YybH family protein [Neolewinella litorea]|uniref:Nuclear transport factor 2 family protein n=1 Tax=Neolewinella litorea TaxID=2562452 RepID=A0A4S4NC47_9BACT|nr:nuclear transport factor 2 family protein [Neolewinella litorea]THH35601.1 nuclear transport factor 2 family protein [Neolewinella litorea]
MRMAFLFLWLVCGKCYAQATPDDLYREFSAAYDRLDAAAVTRLYLDSAYLLNLYDGQPAKSLRGRERIKAYFESFFAGVRERDQRLVLTFRLVDRQSEGQERLDNGYYRLAAVAADGEPLFVSYGKFSTVVRPTPVGYRFLIDATSNADAAEFDSAGGWEIPPRQ